MKRGVQCLSVRSGVNNREDVQETTLRRHVQRSGCRLMSSCREVLRTGDGGKTWSDEFSSSLPAE